MKKLLIVFSLIIVFTITACSDENNAAIFPDEKEVQDETVINDPEIDSDNEDESVETDQAETEEDIDESHSIDIDLREKLITEGNLKDDDIRLFHQDDFDDDGADEAFALAAMNNVDEDDEQIVEGDVWFVSQNGCRKLLTSEAMGFIETDRIITLGNTKYELIDDAYATGTLTYAWYVAGGEAKEASFSKIGTVITDNVGKDQFRIQDSSYDALYDPEVGDKLGHTWKQYYFFYDEKNDSVCEYGGTDIEQSEAEKLCGIDIVEQFLPAGGKLDSLFYRGNGLVVMNYEQEEDGYIYYYHMIYDYKNGTFIDDNGEETDVVPLEGTYAKALCPDMAVYPEKITTKK
ncbi:MAG: hypothetical protein K6B28_11155 [Lachnospiraceae bacterium]|nr:hypothetical protein [Lachnospiraceae bacterium]